MFPVVLAKNGQNPRTNGWSPFGFHLGVNVASNGTQAGHLMGIQLLQPDAHGGQDGFKDVNKDPQGFQK